MFLQPFFQGSQGLKGAGTGVPSLLKWMLSHRSDAQEALLSPQHDDVRCIRVITYVCVCVFLCFAHASLLDTPESAPARVVRGLAESGVFCRWACHGCVQGLDLTVCV